MNLLTKSELNHYLENKFFLSSEYNKRNYPTMFKNALYICEVYEFLNEKRINSILDLCLGKRK